MQRKIQTANISQLLTSKNSFDCIIDVRSPSEFNEDHIPGAINCPVLDDSERVEVGTTYKQIDPFTARKRGAVLTSQNISHHISTFADHPKEWTPLVYCWRGGQRSGSMALVMHEIGWPVNLLQGGYKAFRRQVQTDLEEHLPRLNLIVLTGPTGCGKTDVLGTLRHDGHQILDLEHLANHRGSILGQDPSSDQPPQKLFESRLHHALLQLDLARPIFVESESSKIGELHLPKSLFANIMQSPTVTLSCPRRQRAAYLVEQYAHLTESTDQTIELIQRLKFRHGHQRINAWCQLIKDGQWLDLADSLLEHHYDPAYARSQKRLQPGSHHSLENPGKLESDVILDGIAQ